jgi:hypothetical protein
MSVREPPAIEAPVADDLRCPVCLSLHRPGQRFCLECGATLADPSLPPDPTGRGAGLSGGRRIALAIAMLLLIAAGAAIAWAFTNDDDPGRVRLLVAPPFVIAMLDPTAPATSVPTDGGTLPTTPTEAETFPTFPTEPTGEIPTFSEPPTTEETFPTTEETFPDDTDTDPLDEEPIDEWPGGDAWAVVLISKEVDQFDNAYMEGLRSDAQSRGLSSLGLLYSDNWSTLNPGFRVLYQGPFDTRQAADAAAIAAKADGYDFAYPRRVAP